jgi:hypothetical protein
LPKQADIVILVVPPVLHVPEGPNGLPLLVTETEPLLI